MHYGRSQDSRIASLVASTNVKTGKPSQGSGPVVPVEMTKEEIECYLQEKYGARVLASTRPEKPLKIAMIPQRNKKRAPE